jgi:hypothetical protein
MVNALPICLALALPHVVLAVDVAVDSEPTANLKSGQCVSNYDANDGYDFFPEKYVPSNADLFSIQYHLTYKVITHTDADGAVVQQVVAYQCGTTKPTVANTDMYVSIPVTKVAITSSTYVPWIELLGARTTIKHYTSTFDYVSSPCLIELYDDGLITAGEGADGYLDDNYVNWDPDQTKVNDKLETALGDDSSGTDEALNTVTFANTGSALYRAFHLADTAEDEVFEKAEYVGLISALYNEESKASDAFDSITSRYNCVKNNVQTIKDATQTAWALKQAAKYGEYGPSVTLHETFQSTPPKVLWASFVKAYDGLGWAVGTCPNYYCETIADAGGEMIEYVDSDGVAMPPTVTLYGTWTSYYTDEDLLSLATDADYVILYGGYQDAIDEGKQSAVFDKIKAFKHSHDKHPRVFYTGGLGSNDWFESVTAEPDVLLEDIVTAIWPTTWTSAAMASHTPVWIVPVTQAEGSRGPCTDVDAPLELQANECTALTAASATELLVTAVEDFEQETDNTSGVRVAIGLAISAGLAVLFYAAYSRMFRAQAPSVEVKEDDVEMNKPGSRPRNQRA